MPLTTEQIDAVHYWWCNQLRQNNYKEANINPLFHRHLESFSAHLYELLHLNHTFIEINLKVHNGISLIHTQHNFQPDHSILAKIFNLALEKSALPISAFNEGTQMIINEAGNISVKIILLNEPKKTYDARKILFWNSKTQQNLPVSALPTRAVCLEPERNIDLLMEQLTKTFNSYTTQHPPVRK